jgi:hypothetical protein
MDNDKTIMSNHAGTAFPTTNLEVGMKCFRTDLDQLFELKNLTPTWVLIADLSKTYTNKEYVDERIGNHGNHLPNTEIPSNKKFLRNDGTWQNVTPANIGAAAASHNHDAGNISAGILPVARGGTGNGTGNAATATKLQTGRKINGIMFAGDTDITITQINGKNIVTVDDLAKESDTGIVEGLDLTLGSGLSATVSPGKCNINKSIHILKNAATVTLSKNKSALIYASGLNGNISIGKTETSYPPLDNYHIARYIFNTKNNNIVPDTSPSKNDLTVTGNCEIVGGLCDFAIKTDGSTGYMTSATIPGITTGSIFEVTHVFTFHDRYIDAIISGWSQMYFRSYGGTEHTNLYVKNNADRQTDYTFKNGETYALTLQYDGIFTHVYLNGKYIVAYATAPAAATQKLRIGSHYDANYKSKSVHHYYEIRVGKLRTATEIGEMVHKMGISAEYLKHNGEYPVIPTVDKCCEWKFNNPVSGAAITDSFNNANLTLVGTFKNVNSAVGLGGAINTNGGYGKKDSFIIPQEHTFIFVGVLHDVASEIGLWGMYNGNWWINGIKNGKLAVHNMAGAWRYTNIDMSAHKSKPVFLAYTFKNRVTEFYLNNEEYECIHTDYFPPITAGTLNVLSVGNNTTNRFFGEANYALLIPRALTPNEIKSYYFKLLNPSTYNITNNLQPVNTIALGLIKSGSDKVTASSPVNNSDNFNIQSYFKGSTQVATAVSFTNASNNKSAGSVSQIAGVPSAFYTLQNVIQQLVSRSHTHAYTAPGNCNCNCGCDGCN